MVPLLKLPAYRFSETLSYNDNGFGLSLVETRDLKRKSIAVMRIIKNDNTGNPGGKGCDFPGNIPLGKQRT